MASPQDIPALMAAAHQILQDAEAESRDARRPAPMMAREPRPAGSSRLMFDVGDLDALSDAIAQ